jgi:predicted dehydrogenase
MTARYGCCLVGLGRIASLLDADPKREKPCTHAGAMEANGAFRVLAGCDPDHERRAAFSARGERVSGAPYRAYGRAEDMLDAERPDVVAIASPPDTHEGLLLAAFEREVPVIVCEKPLSHDVAAIARIEAAARRSRSKVVMNYERRFSRDWRWAKGVARSGELGALRALDARVLMGRTRAPSEVARDDATHMVDILRFATGRDATILKAMARDEPGGFLRAWLDFGGIQAQLEVAPGRAYLEFSADLWFDRGMLRVGNGVLERFESRESPYYAGFQSLCRVETPRFEETGYFKGVYAEVERLLADRACESESSLSDGIAALSLIEGIIEASRRDASP